MHDRPFPFPRTGASLPAVDDFADLLARHRPELHRHCTRMLRSSTDAEDAVQDALLNAWRARRSVTSDAPRAWLYRIATNACLDQLARRKAPPAALADDHAPDPEAIVLARETVQIALRTARQ